MVGKRTSPRQMQVVPGLSYFPRARLNDDPRDFPLTGRSDLGYPQTQRLAGATPGREALRREAQGLRGEALTQLEAMTCNLLLQFLVAPDVTLDYLA